MGGYDPNPSSGEPAPAATAAEADAQNRVGRENRERYGLPGYGGRSSEELDYINQQTAQRKQAERDTGGPEFRHTDAYNQAHGLTGPGVYVDNSPAGQIIASGVDLTPQQVSDINWAVEVGKKQADSIFNPKAPADDTVAGRAVAAGAQLTPKQYSDINWAVAASKDEAARVFAQNPTPPPVAAEPNLYERVVDSAQTGVRMTLSPLFLPMAITMDRGIAMIRGNPDPFADILVTDPNAPVLDRAGQLYENLNVALAPYTTDITGIGRSLGGTPDIPGAVPLSLPGVPTIQNFGEAANFAKGTVVGATQHPLDLPVTYAAGSALSLGEGVIGRGIAWGASRGVAGETGIQALKQGQIITATGRALSGPIAADAGTLIKAGVGTYIVGESVVNIAAQPTATLKGEAFGRTAIQFAGFGAGAIKTSPSPIEEPPNRYSQIAARINDIKTVPPENPYAMRTFFAGERKYSPLQSLGMDIRAYATSYEVPKNLRGVYRDIPKAYREIRFMEQQPGITETTPSTGFREPDISIASTIGPERAPAIRAAIGEQEGHVLYGSVIMEAQKTGLPTGDLIRSSGNVHDVDVKVPDRAKLEAALAARGETTAGLDVKDYSSEPGHPLAAGKLGTPDEGIRRIGILTRIFGEAIPTEQGYKLPFKEEVKLGGKDYPGVLNQEPNFARKSQAFMQDLVPAKGKAGNVDARMMNEQYRIPKDYYDTQSLGHDTIAGNQAARIQAGKGGTLYADTPATRIYKAMEPKVIDFDFMPKEDNPIIGAKADVRFQKTMTFGEIKANTEKAILAARASGRPLPDYLKQTPEGERSFTPGLSRSATSAIQRTPVGVSSVLASSPAQSPSGISASSSPSASPVTSPSRSGLSIIPKSTPAPTRSPGISLVSYVPPTPTSVPLSPSPSLPRSPPSSPLISPPSSPSLPPSPYSTPYYPSVPTPPSLPPGFTPPVMPGLPPASPGLPPSGGGYNQFRRKRSSHFTEKFMVGLDMSLKRRSKAKGKSYTSPKKGGKKK